MLNQDYQFPQLLDLSYSVYRIKKRSGKYRTITAPNEQLKKAQSDFSEYLYSKYESLFKSNKHITGFVPEMSIKDNSNLHLNKEWVVNIDIKDFFPSISAEVIKEYMFKDLNLQTDKIIDLCCYEGALPQGSPCSPIIANLIAYWTIDSEILEMAKASNFAYSRYADDLTFSTDKIIDRNKVKEFTNAICNYVNSTKVFKVNTSKINIKHRSQKQLVTGILVNNSESRIPKKTTYKIRAILHSHKLQDKPLDQNLSGLLQYVKQINEQQFNKLTKDFPCKLPTSGSLNHNLTLKDLQKHLDSLS
jgi:hypothetical protein